VNPLLRLAPLVAAPLLVALPLRAEPAVRDSAASEPEPAPHGLEVAARGAAGSGTGVLYMLAGGDVTYRVVPAFGFGAYADFGSVADRYEPCGGIGCARSFGRAGGRIELHLSPSAALDPWVAGEVGAAWVDAESGAPKTVPDAALSIGGDFRPSPDLAIGLFFTAAKPPRTDASYGGYAALGLRVTFGTGMLSRSAPATVARR
jgi:hypothetical protein